MRDGLHVELFETGSAKSVAAVDHDARNTVGCVITFFAERTVVLVEELVDELVDFLAIEIWRVFGLLEKEGSWIFQLFGHQIQNIYCNQIITRNNR